MGENDDGRGGYRDLLVWKVARKLLRAVYDLVDELPKVERWVWELQLKRATSGIAANVAEGYGTGTFGNFRRHVRLARGSASEVQSHLLLIRSANVGDFEQLERCLGLVRRELQLLDGFESYLTERIDDAA